MPDTRTVATDDEAFRFSAVWLGPDGYTLPLRARYVSWGLWLLLQTLFTVLISLLPAAGAADGLVWGFVLAIFGTQLVMRVVDSDLPLAAIPSVITAEASARRRPDAEQTFGLSTAHVRIRSLTAPPPEAS